MSFKDDITINNYGGQFNYAKDDATIISTQNCGLKENELSKIINEVIDNVSYFSKEDSETILDTLKMIQEELSRKKPNGSRLRNCVTLLSPMVTIANGIPQVGEKIGTIISYISQYIN